MSWMLSFYIDGVHSRFLGNANGCATLPFMSFMALFTSGILRDPVFPLTDGCLLLRVDMAVCAASALTVLSEKP